MPKKITKDYTEFVKLIEERYGEDIIEKYEDIPAREIRTIPTGSISLDISTGIGGIARGRFTEIYGPESSGKTSLCLSIAKSAISQGLNVLYVEPENALDYKYIESTVGTIDPKKFLLAQPETAEQTFDICEAAIKSHEFQVVILDSIGSMVTEDEKEDDPTKAHVAPMTRKLGQFLKRNAYEIRKEDVAFILINQIRDAIGNPYAGMSTPGGHILKHLLAVRIQLNKSEDITVKRDDKHEDKIGIYCRFLIKKNKLASPFRTFSFPLIFGEGIDRTKDLINFAEFLGILPKRGAYFTFEGETIGQGISKTKEYLESHKEVLDKIIQLCYNNIVTTKLKGEEDGEIVESKEDL